LDKGKTVFAIGAGGQKKVGHYQDNLLHRIGKGGNQGGKGETNKKHPFSVS